MLSEFSFCFRILYTESSKFCWKILGGSGTKLSCLPPTESEVDHFHKKIKISNQWQKTLSLFRVY